MLNSLSPSTRSALDGPRAQAAIFLCLAQAALVSADTTSNDPDYVRPGDTLDGSGLGIALAVMILSVGVITTTALFWRRIFDPHPDDKPILPSHKRRALLNDNQAPPSPNDNQPPHPEADETESKQSWDGDRSPPSVTSLYKEDVRPPPPYPWELPLYHTRESGDYGYPNAPQGALEPGAFVPQSLQAPPLAHVKNNSPRSRPY